MINSLKELAAELEVSTKRDTTDAWRETIGRRLFKATECGIVFNVIKDGVSVCGYAEGADAECIPKELTYPFTSDIFWRAVEEADKEGCIMWHEWNDDRGDPPDNDTFNDSGWDAEIAKEKS